jgi:transposase InsO family protein
VVDVFARRILGWRMSSSMRKYFVLDALEQAVYERRPEREDVPSVIRTAVLDTSASATPSGWRGRNQALGRQQGDSYDNALAETINGLYKAKVHLLNTADSMSHQLLLNCLVDSSHAGLKAEATRERAIDMEVPRVFQRLGRWFQRSPHQLGQFINRRGRLVGDVDDAAVECALQGKLDGCRDVSMVDRTDPLRWVPLTGDRMLRQFLKMTIPVTVDEREAEYGPLESAVP